MAHSFKNLKIVRKSVIETFFAKASVCVNSTPVPPRMSERERQTSHLLLETFFFFPIFIYTAKVVTNTVHNSTYIHLLTMRRVSEFTFITCMQMLNVILLTYNIKHLMTGPEGNSKFCFPRI